MPVIIKGAREFSERAAPWMRISKDEATLARIVTYIGSLNGIEILLAEHDGRVVGGAAVLYIPYVWNPLTTVAEKLFWFAFRDAPASTGPLLLEEVMQRVHKQDAIPMFRAPITNRSGIPAAYRRYGLAPVETVFTEVP